MPKAAPMKAPKMPMTPMMPKGKPMAQVPPRLRPHVKKQRGKG